MMRVGINDLLKCYTTSDAAIIYWLTATEAIVACHVSFNSAFAWFINRAPGMKIG